MTVDQPREQARQLVSKMRQTIESDRRRAIDLVSKSTSLKPAVKQEIMRRLGNLDLGHIAQTIELGESL